MADLGSVDRDVPAAIHSQISDHFRTQIASGEWPASYRLPSEPELAVRLCVSRGTIRRALRTLIHEGLLRQIHGRGTFVTAASIEPAIAQKLTTLSEDYARQGITTVTEVIDQRIIVPPLPVAALLDVRNGGTVFQLYRRHIADQGPIALLHNFVRAVSVPHIEDVDFTSEGLFATIEGTYQLRIASGRRTFSAESASEAVAANLDLPVGSPVQYLEQVTYLDDGEPIEYSDVWIRPDRLRVTSLLSRHY